MGSPSDQVLHADSDQTRNNSAYLDQKRHYPGRVLQLLVLLGRSDRAEEIEILALGHRVTASFCRP
jgi:hypothetical protein